MSTAADGDKHFMHRFWRSLLLLGPAWLLSLSGPAAAQLADWTVMVYMAGDNELEPWIVKDLENELGKVGSSPEIEVVALADRHPGYDHSRGDWSDTRLFHVSRGLLAMPGAAVAGWGERNMGDPRTLTDFVGWAKAHYPARRYALFFWGHGWNWHSGFVMADESAEDALDPAEIAAAQPLLGPLDLVAYDGCNMGAIEVETLWHGHATALVHSQEYVGWDGIGYDVLLAGLRQRPAMDADELARLSNHSASLHQELTGSAVAVDTRFDRLLQAVDGWAQALLAQLPQRRADYAAAFAAAWHFDEAPADKDLADLVGQVTRRVPQLRSAGDKVLAAIAFVRLDEWHVPAYGRAHGISISAPAPGDQDWDEYRRSLFARTTHWDELLAAMAQGVSRPSSSPAAGPAADRHRP